MQKRDYLDTQADTSAQMLALDTVAVVARVDRTSRSLSRGLIQMSLAESPERVAGDTRNRHSHMEQQLSQRGVTTCKI
jgi:hypothetical protein